jgi:hypothetical protein
MAHYAYLDSDRVVTSVIVGRDEEAGADWEAAYAAEAGLPASQCKRTSYNTVLGVHLTGGVPYRHTYAGIGYHFDPAWGTDGGFLPPPDEEPAE